MASNKVSTVETDVSTVENKVSTVETDVPTVENDVSTVENDVSTVETDVSSVENDALVVQNLSSTLQRLIEPFGPTDMTINCQGVEFKTHRDIVCHQSNVFAAAMRNGFMEAETGIVNLEEECPEMIGKMVQFFYTGHYDDNRSISEDIDSTPPRCPKKQVEETANGPLLTNAKLFVLGEYYDVPKLKCYATDRYAETVESRWQSEYFVKSIEMVYQNCMDPNDAALKKVMVSTTARYIQVLRHDKEFVAMLKNHVDFMYSVLSEVVVVKPRWKWPVCWCGGVPHEIMVLKHCWHCKERLNIEMLLV